ncbi:MAG: phytanoyl-CoA dioxygenase family protein [Planctomycetaceae bacterium]|nr:phytanoyl-CoA dioxygenase family protein [Planctomycetaceae bacterium]MBT4724752.1 phytanoyl-CoA dioxygenase family protein [Planctomycetaceae bacterium]MBT4844351.1 phytanoyl-CoA dioxygenase family protein [Planctomycetaceae bacterium]MBT5124336.1 phytanoyl-CoA dioxygenase family protein [Planctomycetaceae bacterium]MBT5599141.1 phytanoyl-CoA dioxygenase family protein [Planctomycetaceae bacterium]
MKIDLSTISQPIGKYSTAADGNLQRFRLTKDQVNSYRKHGFVVGKESLSEEFMELLCADLDFLISPENANNSLWHECHLNECDSGSDVLFHALGAWRISEGFHDLLWQPAVTIPATQLLDADIRFWHDQLFYKPPKHGGGVAWHQDYSYWTRTSPMSHLTCWVALEDATIANGCLHYVAGSHRWQLLPIIGLAGEMKAIKDALTEEQHDALRKPHPIELRRGQMVFHHPLTVHGSFQNTTDKSRPGAVINMLTDGVSSNCSEPLLTGIPVIPVGEPLVGQFFPLLRRRGDSL